MEQPNYVMGKHGKGYVDPFALYETERKNRERLIIEKRLKVKTGISSTTDGSDITNGKKRKNGESRSSNQESKRLNVAISSTVDPGIGEKIGNLPLSITELGPLINFNNEPKALLMRRVTSQRYSHLNGLIPRTYGNYYSLFILQQLCTWIVRVIDWFKNNRFDYIITNKNLDQIKEAVNSELMAPEMKPNLDILLETLIENSKNSKEEEENGILLSLLKLKYLPSQSRRKRTDLLPTCIVENTKKVGIYMIYASVKDLKSKKSLDVILMKADNRVELEIGDLLVLPRISSSKICIKEIMVPVYSTFQLYQKRSLDADFYGK